MRRSLTLAALTACLLTLGGCGSRLHAVNNLQQELPDGDRAAHLTQQAVSVTVRQAEVPSGFRDDLLAVEVHVANRSGVPVSLGSAQVSLLDAAGLWYPAMNPGELSEGILAGYAVPPEPPPPVRIGIGVGYVHGGGRWGHPFGYGWGEDPYADRYATFMRERSAAVRFVMDLWRERRTVEPGQARHGVFVFDHVPPDDRYVRVRITLEQEGLDAVAAPAPTGEAAQVFVFDFLYD